MNWIRHTTGFGRHLLQAARLVPDAPDASLARSQPDCASADTDLLDVRNLTVTLNKNGTEQKVLDDVSFSVRRGEVLGVVGESGAGKSMTGAAVARLLVPPLRRSGGTITLGGERLDQLPESQMRRVRGGRIGFIFQDPMTSLNPVLTIGQQLVDTLQAHLPLNRAQARERAVHWIERVGLPTPAAQLARYPHQLSGGMRQRIVIALALCAEPELVIADEPTTALDVSVQAHILQLLRDLHRQSGISMMLITHDLGVMAKMADRVAVFYAGRIVEMSPVQALFDQPRHPYTAGLIQATPNCSPDGVVRLAQIPGAMPAVGRAPSGCTFHPRCARAEAGCAAQVPPASGDRLRFHTCFHPLNTETESQP